MRRSTVIALCAVSATALVAASLAGCGQTRRSMGFDKRAPDEFTVVSRAPLSIPPEYSLRPPDPGAPRPQQGTTRDQAKRQLVGRQVDTQQLATSSSGQDALLKRVGADQADPDIRRTVDRETSALAEEDQVFTEKLMFWEPNPAATFGTVVDPEGEMQRLRETQALGDPVTTGETPSIKRKARGLLEGIFN